MTGGCAAPDQGDRKRLSLFWGKRLEGEGNRWIISGFYKANRIFLPAAQRCRQTVLALLEGAIQSRQAEIEAALARDLGKSRQEAYMTEIAVVLEEIHCARRHLKSWSRARRAPVPISHLPGRQWTRPVPYGSVLILSPWNYPFQLCMSPLVSALAAGNCAVVKPSELAEHTALAVCALLEEIFSPEYVSVCRRRAYRPAF